MTQIYCNKCTKFTNTNSEELTTTKKGRTRVSGVCKTCGTKKGMFVSKDGTFTKKAGKELEEAKQSRQFSTLKKKALAIGWKALYDKDTTNCVINCLPEHIRPETRKKKKEKID